MSDDQKQDPSQRPGALSRDPLSQRRPLKQEDDYYDRPLCPCEETDPENQSEYDVAGEWVTYDGPINEDIFDGAASNAALELEAQMRAYYQEPAAPPPPGALAPAIPNDEAPKPVDEVNDEWAAVMAEIYALDASADAKLAAKEASEAAHRAEKLDAVATQAMEWAKREARVFATTGDIAVKNLVYYFKE